jgi:hypothetical protein
METKEKTIMHVVCNKINLEQVRRNRGVLNLKIKQYSINC